MSSGEGGMNVELTGVGEGKTDGQCRSSRRPERSFVLQSPLNVAGELFILFLFTSIGFFSPTELLSLPKTVI